MQEARTIQHQHARSKLADDHNAHEDSELRVYIPLSKSLLFDDAFDDDGQRLYYPRIAND